MSVRKKCFLKPISIVLISAMVYQLLFPVFAFALTGGPAQPETQGFAPISSTDMVDLFTGDFKYNIPLVDVGGYPINLVYNSNPSMDQEASWVGLGWSLNPGAINRTLRGLPDDFLGDTIRKEYNILENKSWGVNLGGQVKIFGLPIGINGGISQNNYKGYGVNLGLSASMSSSEGNGGGMTGSLGVHFSSQDGVSLSASAGMSKKDDDQTSTNTSIGLGYNNRAGLKELTLTRSTSATDQDSKYTKSGGVSSASISFATPTFTPTISMPLNNVSFNLEATIGGEIFGVHPDIKISGFWSKQSLKSHSRTLPAYGYQFSASGRRDMSALMDFNREKDVAYVKTIPNLPLPNYTYDLFSASGQGMSGQFRAHRGDVGILFDSQISSGSESVDAGIELGFGNAFHGSVPINQMDVVTTTKKWSSTNSLDPVMDFKDNSYGLFENSYFKCIGEQSSADDGFYNLLGFEEPIVNQLIPIICTNNNQFKKYSIRTNSHLNTFGINYPVRRYIRDKRTQLFSSLNGREASSVGLNKSLISFKPGVLPYKSTCGEGVFPGREFDLDADTGSYVLIPRTTRPFSYHHMSEVTITKPDGKRYVYSIPAYNNIQKDVTFNCQDLGIEPSDGLVSYVPDKDNTIKDEWGIDNYFNAETVPGYAYAYLLGGILSPDYIDRTGNGISSDDPGEAIRLNYSRTSDRYQWRIPYNLNTASYNGGLNAGNGHKNSSVLGDAKGTYTYGTKELWYMHSVESKTMLAMFYLADRFDGIGVSGENGGMATDSLGNQKLLKEIRLFSKADILRFGSNAIPVKTIHFEYDYSLCPNVPNNNQAVINNTGQYSYYKSGYFNANKGKLTLKKIYFTYGNNTKGQLNSYQFTYSSSNPAYGLKNYDRWGNYKENTSSMPTNAEFPYTLQDTSLTNSFSRSWNIEQIDLPSGGSILVNLESDDYAYVQDRRAGQMFFIEGFGIEGTPPTMYPNQLYEGQDQYNIIFIKVDNSSGDIQRKYFQDLNKIYYRCSVDLGNTTINDYISGYVEIDKSGTWCGAIDANTIYVKIKKVDGKNPISKNCWQFLKNNLPEVAYPGSSDPGATLGDALMGLLGSIGEISQIITGGDKYAIDKGWGKKFDPTHSWVRLTNPDFKKLGGGSRVKSLLISDNWNNMAPDGVVKTYGQEYLYADTTNEGYISSGVASWEPSIGNDENPFRQPVNYKIEKKLVEPDRYYLEEPFGESFFPSASVGYSKVIVANISNPHVRRTATGFTVNEFYTGKDFPVITAYTDPLPVNLKPPFKLSILGSSFSLEKWAVSQGYMVEVNDMHGKEKATKIYNAMGSEISSTRYYYKQDDLTETGKPRISNKADVIFKDGKIRNRTIGEDIDLAMDMREQSTETSGMGITINLDGFLAGFIFAAIPMPIPRFTRESKKFRSTVAMKVIHRYGVLDKVVATKDGSTIETRNLLRDAETGEVLMTQTQNEFGDSLYNFTYPAHWAYQNMGSGYENTGVSLEGVEVTDGDITGLSDPFSYLNEGDEILVTQNGQTFSGPYYVGKFNSNNSLRLMNGEQPASFTGDVTLKVIRSGKRNMPVIPIGSVATVHRAPIDSTGSTPKLKIPDANFVTQASATEFYDKWKIECNKILITSCDTTNPEFCLDYLINLMIGYNQSNHSSLFNLCYNDSVTVHDLYNMCNCKCSPDSIGGLNTDQIPFYNPTCPMDLSSIISHSWNFGECSFIMNSLSGNPVNLDSLQPIDPVDTSASCSKVYVGANHTDSVSFCVECITCHDSCTDQSALNAATSPYHFGMFNNWHQKKTWSYYARRTPGPIVQSRIRVEGTFNEFTPFWEYNTSTKIWENNDGIADENWIATNTVTRINAPGAEIENKDALERYSAAIYGYLQTLPKAVASNARYRQIANDNFEDYDFRTTCRYPCYAEHWNFESAINSPNVIVTDVTSHTGNSSLAVAAGENASVYREIKYSPEDTLVLEDTVNYQYLMRNGCIGKFSPDSGRYILSAWVKEAGACGPLGYTNDSILISYAGSAVTTIFYPSGVVIEGWQRYEGIFDVPGDATGISVTLIAGDYTTYFDDIRIHPYYSNMKSFVNDVRSLRLMSELDANNYATLYEYDDEGKLIRVKKETERGIMTLKESRSVYKNN